MLTVSTVLIYIHKFNLLTCFVIVLATGQLAKDIAAIIKELEYLYGTLNEDNFRLE